MPAEQTFDPGSGGSDNRAAGEMEIREVVRDAGERIEGHFRVAGTDGAKLEIVGWALGTESPAAEIEIASGADVAGRAPVALERPDVAELFPDLPEAATAGFRIELAAHGSGESELEIRVRLKDESRERLGRVLVWAGRRRLLDTLRRV